MIFENKEIKILGTKWKIEYVNDTDWTHLDMLGYTDDNLKTITLLRYSDEEIQEYSEDKIQYAVNLTMRHEILHAFMYESGLGWDVRPYEKGGWNENEEMIDFFARQFPKIHKVYKKLNIM